MNLPVLSSEGNLAFYLQEIKKFPILMGGTNNFDSQVIKITRGHLFCKGGAEGILLFSDFKSKVGGVIKILDGNNRAIPSIAIRIFSKLKILNENEKNELKKWENQILYNHAKKNIGKIKAQIKYK